MAFFVGAGTIADDVVRKETRNGVLAVFRLKTGAPNNRRLWIDVETWGQLAGTIAHHGAEGRPLLVSGRLTYKTWRDKSSGEARSRLVVTALDIDLLGDDLSEHVLPTSVIATGGVDSVQEDRPTKNGTLRSFRIGCGRAGSKSGRLWIDVNQWQHRDSQHTAPVSKLDRVTVFGSLQYRATSERRTHLDESSMSLRASQVALTPRSS